MTLPAYRGDMVNDFAFTRDVAHPRPAAAGPGLPRVSSATLNLVRAFTTGGFADLRHVHDWNRGFVANSANARYERLAKDIDKAMKFMAACGADFDAMRTVEFFAAHEALLLDYERPMTRIDSRTGLPYDTSAHFVWVGERTRDLDGAHIDFVSRIRNPIGVKLVGQGRPRRPAAAASTRSTPTASRAGSPSSPGWAPARSARRCRRSSRRSRRPARRSPGSATRCTATPSSRPPATRPATSTTSSTRCAASSRCTARLGTVPGGIHVELTGNDVTECLGGSEKILDADLEKRYESVCDPRLNHQQSLELAFLVAEMLGERP